MMTVRLGMLTPSSNTVLEPITMAMLAGVSGVTAHFSRFKVTEIALSQQALGQFDHGEVLRAAELLAHAKVDVIAWNGTSASWLDSIMMSACATHYRNDRHRRLHLRARLS
jgi:maleate isomerase